jgi:ribosomal protein S18 acetylase RimI-like enzyme
VGQKLLAKVTEEAVKMNCAKITLEVRTDNPNARHLYSKMGFRDMDPPQFFWAKYL